MSPENAQAMEPAPAGMSEFSRITGVFFEPKKTFADIAERPRWLVPLVLLILAGLAFTFMIGQRIGWERIIRQQMDTNPRTQQMTPEQREQGVAIGVKFATVAGYAGPIVFTPIMYLIIAGVVTGIVAGIMSAGVKFRQVFAIVCYAGLPAIIYSILGIVLMFIKNPDDFNMKNPLAFNPGAFMDPTTTSKFVYSLSTSLDLFSIWTILLIAVGLKAAAGKRLSFTGALFAVALPWAVLILGKAALSGTGLMG
jgi:hypothetical protein